MNKVATVFKKEIVDSIRDRRTLVTSVLMPIFLMPLILIGSMKFQEYQQTQQEKKGISIAINDAQAGKLFVDFVSKTLGVKIKQTNNYTKDIDAGTIQVYIKVSTDFSTKIQKGESSSIEVFQKSSNLDSAGALQKITSLVTAFNQEQSVERLAQKNISPQILTSIIPRITDIATAQERGGLVLSLLLPMFIVLFAIIGGMYIAIDVSAGEKERKTLEALILSPASRLQLVTGKFLAVAATASTTIFLSLFSLYAAFKLFPPKIGVLGELTINITPAAIGVMLGMGIILAIMFSALLLSVAIFAKSYKEAQNYISPFYILTVVPIAIFSELPGFKPVGVYFLIPAVNAVFVIKEVLVGVFNTTHILVTIGSLIVYAIIAIFLASSIYSKEGILFRD